jgi:hypothetical protein
MTYYEELATARPFDDSDDVLNGTEAPTPPRSWQHLAARSALAYVVNRHDFRDTFALHLWPESRRVQLINDICNIIEVSFKPEDQFISDQIFKHIRADEYLDNEFSFWLDCDEFDQMVEDVDAVIADIYVNRSAA